MSRYIKKFKSTTALGPTEERGFALWVGYDIEGVSDDLSHAGLINVDDWDEEELRARGVTTFTRIAAGDAEMHDKLGI
jgi:predicted flap endonuclease-1-like 5' DNA nuclease